MVAGYDLHSTDVLIQHRMDLEELIALYNVDYMLLEGVIDLDVPRIIASKSLEGIDPFLDKNTIAVSGVIAEEIKEFKGLPVFNVLRETEELLDFIVNSKAIEEIGRENFS